MLLKNPIIIKTGMFQILYERRGGRSTPKLFPLFWSSWREWLAQKRADIKVITKIDLKPTLGVSVPRFLKVQKFYFLFLTSWVQIFRHGIYIYIFNLCQNLWMLHKGIWKHHFWNWIFLKSFEFIHIGGEIEIFAWMKVGED